MLYPNGTANRPAVSSPFGPRTGGAFSFHYGADLVGFTRICAVAPGKVTFAGWMNDAAGNTIVIDHGDGVTSLYMHNATHDVRRGDRVDEGQHIAVMGRTGNASGNCNHLEIRVRGTSVEPLAYIAARLSRPTGTPTPSNPSNPATLPEEIEMFIAIVNGDWFLIVPQGTAKPRAVVLGGESQAAATTLPKIHFTWASAVAALKRAVDF